MGGFHFRCYECRSVYAETEVQLVCPRCTKHQQPGGTTRGVLEVVCEELPSSWPTGSITDPGFLQRFLPLPSSDLVPSLPVGGTPLLEVPELRRALEMSQLWIKDDTRNPSGSTKDRASLLVVAKAKQYGYETVAAASTGNAATALAAVAAAAGIRAVVFVPAAAPEAKLVQMLNCGALVMPVIGNYDVAFELCQESCRQFGWYNRNTALNPFTIEGKKTAALEIAADLAPDVPDVIFVPTGDGVILAGIAKGFDDLRRSGLTSSMPRLIAVQPEGSSAIVRALVEETESAKPHTGASSVADSLVVESPRNALQCLRYVRESGGGGVTVTEQEIISGIAELASSTGVFAEPAGAAVLPGLKAALAKGLVDRHERVVLLVTGSGLKDVATASKAVQRPAPVHPQLDEVRKRLGDEL